MFKLIKIGNKVKDIGI